MGFLRWLRPYLSRKYVSVFLVVTGIALLVYVASAYWDMFHTQRTLEAQWEQQAAAAAKSSPGVRTVSADELLTRVVIPKINLDSIVVEGVSHRQLSIGPGHLKDTATPGEPGNSVISGHRDTFFRHIYELQKGDDIMIRRNGQVFRYQVTGKRIVPPDDVSVLKPTTDAQLTLITCYPTYYIGPAPKRLVIFSKLVDSGSEAQPAAQPVSERANQ